MSDDGLSLRPKNDLKIDLFKAGGGENLKGSGGMRRSRGRIKCGGKMLLGQARDAKEGRCAPKSAKKRLFGRARGAIKARCKR